MLNCLLTFDSDKSVLNPVGSTAYSTVSHHRLYCGKCDHTFRANVQIFLRNVPRQRHPNCACFIYHIYYTIVGVFCTTTWHNTRNIWAHSRIWTCTVARTHINLPSCGGLFVSACATNLNLSISSAAHLWICDRSSGVLTHKHTTRSPVERTCACMYCVRVRVSVCCRRRY